MPCPLPRRTEPVRLSVASRLVRPAPYLRRVGVRDFPCDACSGLLRVTACGLARPAFPGLCHQASARTGHPIELLVSFPAYRQLHRWAPPSHRVSAPKRRTEKCGLRPYYQAVPRWTFSRTSVREFLDIVPSGKQVTGINVYRIAGGKVEEDWVNWDALGWMQRSGRFPQL